MQTDARTLLNLPAKCGGAFKALAIPRQKKKKITPANSQLNLLGVRRETARSSRVRIPHVCVQPRAQLKASVSFPVDIGFALHRGALHRFAFPSIWPLLYFANSRLTPPLAAFQSPPPRPSHTAHDFTAFFPRLSASDPRALSRFAVFPHRDETDWARRMRSERDGGK